jgi:hypothetical protein
LRKQVKELGAELQIARAQNSAVMKQQRRTSPPKTRRCAASLKNWRKTRRATMRTSASTICT